MLLAVETSSSLGSIALMSDGVMIAERQLGTAGPRHAQTLIPELDRLLRELGSGPENITAIAVSIGPGSFTGLRVGLTFAKTLAWLNDAPLVAVDTLQAIAQQASPDEQTVTAVCDAQRGELFAASYELDSSSGLRRRLGEVRVQQIADLISGNTVIGPLPLTLRQRVVASRVMASESVCMPKASSVARIGDVMLKHSQVASPETLEPVYIRVSYAEEKRPVSARNP